ncbi:MAG: YHYH domain-containing protein, partial [Fretibacterium sp.]|nr:YHYH domain-containing protein [Fretibacterium sp.]
MLKFRRVFIAVFFVLSLAAVACAHPGKLDENGGHYESRTGKYHYHKGPKAGTEIVLTSYPVKANAVYKAKIKRVVDGDT